MDENGTTCRFGVNHFPGVFGVFNKFLPIQLFPNDAFLVFLMDVICLYFFDFLSGPILPIPSSAQLSTPISMPVSFLL